MARRSDLRHIASATLLSATVLVAALPAMPAIAASEGASPGPASSSAASASAGRAAWQVTVDGLSVTGHCTGTRDPGEPVVILQAGNGGGEDALLGIEDHLSARAQVCAFGRPGAGGNPAPAERPRSVDVVVAEVHAILEAAGIEPPYFVIGHSAGGAISFMFAQAFPDEVTGFVDINGNPPIETWSAAALEAGLPQEFVDGAMADFSGQNPEGIDFRSNESMLTEPLPPEVPYAVIYDECGDGPDCFAAFEGAVFQAIAEAGQGGRSCGRSERGTRSP